MGFKRDQRPPEELELTQRILDQLPVLIAVVTGSEYRYRYANHEANRALFGDRDCIGQAVSDVFPKEVADRTRAILDRVRATGERVVGAESNGGIHPDRFYNFIYEPLPPASRVKGG